MTNTAVQVVLAISIFLLVGSLWVVVRIRGIIHQRRLRRAWAWLGATLLPAALGCLLFLYTNDIEGDTHQEDWLVALTLFVAAVFVFGVCSLSLSTATDLARIDDLEKAAFFDPVTNVYARGHIDSLLQVEWDRSRAETVPLSVMMLDIDDFKFINDCFGHCAGDYVLKEIGRILKQTINPANVVGRYGGEEFLVLAPNTPPVLAEEIAERLRTKLATAHLELQGNAIPLTVSIGVKTTFTFRESAKELVADADLAMYEAKRRGRNQVVVSDGAPRDLGLPKVGFSRLTDMAGES